MRIPSLTSIVNRALDLRSDALNQNDPAGVAHIDTMIRNLYRGAKLRWNDDGALLVASCNTIGAVYATTAHSCSCEARGPCWHMRVFELLVDMLETEAETADMAAS